MNDTASSHAKKTDAGVARYVMVGGFLGAGKTTALDAFAGALTARGRRVGLITNDQSSGLVDTAVLRARGFDVEEIAGGCFCCRFDSLRDAAERLTDSTRPDVFFAEPVGSCTDLLATVTYPLRRIYGDRFHVAPLSVMVDPHRAARVFGLVAGRSFSEKVLYVYGKQLEEAEIIVVNKCDEITVDDKNELVGALSERYSNADIVCVSAKSGDGMDAWLERVMTTSVDVRSTMNVDYVRYAEGEAELGWLNATFAVTAPDVFDGNALLVRLAAKIRDKVGDRDDIENGEIAHLKMTLDSPDAGGQLSAVSLVRSDAEPDVRESLLDLISGGSLIVNFRAETAPEKLSSILAEVIATESDTNELRFVHEHEERFRPAPPVPTHRIEVSS